MREFRLNNGINACIKTNKNTPRTAFCLNFSINKPQKFAGEYLLMNRLLLRGTQKYSSEELSAILDENAIELYTEMKKYANNLKFNPVFSTNHHPDFEIDVNDYIKSTTELFDYWLYDKNGIIVEPLSLYMSKALGLPHSSCANSSCLGKWLDIDSKGVIRTCGQSQDEPFIIGHLDEVEKLSDVFMSEQFNNLLTKAIARREKCKASCKFFLECQGNCLFKSYIENGIEELNGFSCKAFRGIYGYIKMKTIELLKNKVPLDTLNPIAKKIIADAISSNPKFISGIING
jgi:uncharacterized protein